jgi:ATP-binding cassette subfamily B multidrug efflux pump
VRRLAGYLGRYRTRYLLGGACLLVTASLAMAVPYLLKRAIDAITQGHGSAGAGTFAGLIALVAVVQAVTRTWSRALIFNVGRDVEYDLRNDLFSHLLRLPASYFQVRQTGDLMSRLINDVTAIRMLLGVGMLNLLNTPLYYAYGVTIMLTIDPKLTALSLLSFPALLLMVKRVSRQLMEQTLRVQGGLAALSASAQENVSGIHVIKAYGIEDVAVEQFSRLNDEFTRQSLELARVRGRLMPIMKLGSGVGTMVVLWYGGLQVIRGTLGLGDLVAFIAYLNLLAWPTMAMGWMLSVVQRGRAALVRLEEIFAVEPEIRERPGALPLAEVRGRIEFDNVSFAYPGEGNGHPVLSGVSFAVEPGEKLAIVGRTGAGKSTLVSLLPRLFDVTSGAVRIDGRDVRDLPLDQLRVSIGFVPQDPFLFSATIAENIAFASDHAGEAEIGRAARIAGVAGDIGAFPRGYQTVVGERGLTLSGGQKQRLTLARAVAAEPRILVLDDALSSVDTRTEREILDQLGAVLEDRTSLLIAHRVSTILRADRILVLDGGRVVEFGDHATLLAQDGLYAELFREQQLQEEIAEL